ncbi:MAG: CoA pyrophosphatase [Desulfobacterales bacterium]
MFYPFIFTGGFETIDYSRLKEIIANSKTKGSPADDSRVPASVFLLLFKRSDPHILAIQKSDTKGYPWRNQVALPGGHVESSDAGPLAAAFRELEEELNISKDQVDFIGSLGYFQTLTKPRDIEAFIGLWNGQGSVRFDTKEIARVLEIPLKTLVDIHQAKRYHDHQTDTREPEYPFGDVVIWGATAKIIHRFIELIYPLVH